MQGLLSVLPNNLCNLQLDIDDAINSMLIVLDDIAFLEQHLNLKLININLEGFEKEELRQALAEHQIFCIPPQVKPNSK